MKRPLTCAIIGCGAIAPEHIRSFQFLSGVRIKWACDLVRAKAEARAAEYGIPEVATDFRRVLADPEVDCVSICTDHGSHARIAAAALHSGKDVLCEKALAASQRGLRTMLAAHAAHPDRVFGGVFQHRFDAAQRYLKRLIDDGALGTVLTCDVSLHCLRTDAYYEGDAWRGTWAGEGGGVLINQAIHFMDLAAWHMGGMCTVQGAWMNVTRRASMETEDTAVAAVRYAGGALGTITATVSSHLGWDAVIAIRGTEGSVDIRNGQATYIDFADAARARRVTKGFAAAKDRQHRQPVKSYYGPNHPALIADFVDAVRTRREPFVTARSAAATVEAVLAVYASHRTGRVQTLRLTS